MTAWDTKRNACATCPDFHPTYPGVRGTCMHPDSPVVKTFSYAFVRDGQGPARVAGAGADGQARGPVGMTPRPSCYWCDSPAARSCDRGLGGGLHICLAVMCSEHVTVHGGMDVCPLHVGAAPGKAPRSYEEAQRMRREIRALAARSRFEVVSDG